jgi:hypothetical protein
MKPIRRSFLWIVGALLVVVFTPIALVIGPSIGWVFKFGRFLHSIRIT